MSGKKIKIGIFGGSFNPPHIGHLILAERAMEQLKLDKLLFIPAFLPPHKIGEKIADSGHRIKMLRQAIKSNPDFLISGIEVSRKGASYTYDTLIDLKNQYPNAKFFLLIGYDNLISFHLWKNYNQIFKLCTLAVYNRVVVEKNKKKMHSVNYPLDTFLSIQNTIPEINNNGAIQDKEILLTKPSTRLHSGRVPSEHGGPGKGLFISDTQQSGKNKKIIFLTTPILEISSSEIRKRIKSRQRITNLVPENVEKYIYKNNLYNSS